ncbi:MAG: hypothetical protein AABW71_04760 [Nanoarchaeota archaeon]
MVFITNEGRFIVNPANFYDSKRTRETLDRLALQLETSQGILAFARKDGSIDVRPIGGSSLEIFEKSLVPYVGRTHIPMKKECKLSLWVGDTQVNFYRN